MGPQASPTHAPSDAREMAHGRRQNESEKGKTGPLMVVCFPGSAAVWRKDCSIAEGGKNWSGRRKAAAGDERVADTCALI